MSKTNAAEAPFDPHTRLVDPETGLEYEDFAAKLLGEPIKSNRNGNIRSYRQSGYDEVAIRAYWEAFDRSANDHTLGPSKEFGLAHAAGLDAAKATGSWPFASNFDPLAIRSEQLASEIARKSVLAQFLGSRPRPAGARAPAALQAPVDPLHAAPEPPLQGRLGP